jgi:hypothetical protein
MSARKPLSFILSDDQMRVYLAANRSLVFEGLAMHWQEVERQVERLGYGEKYFVSRTKGVRGDLTKVTPAGR